MLFSPPSQNSFPRLALNIFNVGNYLLREAVANGSEEASKNCVVHDSAQAVILDMCFPTGVSVFLLFLCLFVTHSTGPTFAMAGKACTAPAGIPVAVYEITVEHT